MTLSISPRDLVTLASTDEKRKSSFSVFVVAGRQLGDASPVAEMKHDFEAATNAGDFRVIYQFGVRVRRTFSLDSLKKLESIFAEIGEDLRRQSLVIYQTEPSGSEWRPVEVSLRGGGRLRSPEGVYVAGEGADEQ